MKRLLFITMIALAMNSCSKEEPVISKHAETAARTEANYVLLTDQKGGKLYMFFETVIGTGANAHVDRSLPTVYSDAARIKPVIIPWFMCAAGIYTNGHDTYTVTWNTPCGVSGSNLFLDDFCQCAYCYSVAWGGHC